MDATSLAEQRKSAETGEYVPYSVKTFALDAARTDELVECQGEFVHAWTDGTLAGVSIKFNSRMNSGIDLARHNPVYGLRFWRLYLTTTAQAGKTLDLFIGLAGVKASV